MAELPIADDEIDSGLRLLRDTLQAVRRDGDQAGLLVGWGGLVTTSGSDLASVLLSDAGDREVRRLVLGLLDKCVPWDEAWDVAVDPAVEVAGVARGSFGIAFAAQSVDQGHGIAVLVGEWTDLLGSLRVVSDVNTDVFFIKTSGQIPGFLRTLFRLEAVAEDEFFSLAARAFPSLAFAPSLAFRRFEGGYSVRDIVVQHLSALNDNFMHAYESERGHSAAISQRLGIDVSIEGETRSSERLMGLRDIEYDGEAYRCEWHSKLEPHRNRIHFYPGLAGANRILIGIFVDHLET